MLHLLIIIDLLQHFPKNLIKFRNGDNLDVVVFENQPFDVVFGNVNFLETQFFSLCNSPFDSIHGSYLPP